MEAGVGVFFQRAEQRSDLRSNTNRPAVRPSLPIHHRVFVRFWCLSIFTFHKNKDSLQMNFCCYDVSASPADDRRAAFPPPVRPSPLRGGQVFISSTVGCNRCCGKGQRRSRPAGVPPCPSASPPGSPQVDGQGHRDYGAHQHQERQPGLQKPCTAGSSREQR